MCLEDLKLGRTREYGPVVAVAGGAGAALALNADARRTALLLSFWINTSISGLGAALVPDFGALFTSLNLNPFFALSSFTCAFLLRIEDVGQIIQGPISAHATDNNSIGTALLIQPIFTNLDIQPYRGS